MKFTIKLFDRKLRVYYDNKFKNYTDFQGYVFKDTDDNTIMIVYGESRRDFIEQELLSSENILKLQYKILKIK